MAVGDVVADTASVANGAYMTIQPGSGVEWVIHNLYWSGASVEVSKYDGTNEVKFASDTTFGALLNVYIHVTNTDYLRIKNVSGSAAVICGYDGVITK
jgi:hypothetical protein